MPWLVSSMRRLRSTSASWIRRSSSNTSRRRASSASRIVSGWWMLRSAALRSTKSCWSSTQPGTGSTNSSVRRSDSPTHARNSFE